MVTVLTYGLNKCRVFFPCGKIILKQVYSVVNVGIG